MRRRWIAFVLLLVVGLVVASMASCNTDVPSEPDATQSTDVATPDAPSPEIAARRARRERRRMQRDAGTDPAPPDANSKSGIGVSGASAALTSKYSPLRTGQVEGVGERPAAEPTGRVVVTILKDGKPFKGGHICFYSEDQFVEPGPWDGVTSDDYAYAGAPFYANIWPHFDPVLGAGRPIQRFERVRGITDKHGRVALDIPAGRRLVVFVRHAMSGIPLVTNPRVEVAEGEDVSVTIEAATQRAVSGKCVDADGKPLAGIVVQALAPGAERPVSRTHPTSVDGTFRLHVFGDDTEIRLRAFPPNYTKPFGIYDTEAECPSIPGETTIAGVVPGVVPVEIRMLPTPVVIVELTAPKGDRTPGNMQVEGLVYDPRVSAWGRLGGPRYQRTKKGATGRQAFLAIPRADADRPLMLWSWGRSLTGIDPRGVARTSAHIPKGRRAELRGNGWLPTDRVRVISFIGPPGQEFPAIWIDDPLGKTNVWARDDSPPCAIEFQIVRDDEIIGRSERVPASNEAAVPVRIDLE